MTKGLPLAFFASKESVTGTSAVEMVVAPPWSGSRQASICAALERRRRPLRGKLQGGEKDQGDALHDFGSFKGRFNQASPISRPMLPVCVDEES